MLKEYDQNLNSFGSVWVEVSRIISSPEPKAQGELKVWDSSHASVRASTLSNMNISETSRPIIIKFHQKHLWGGG